MNELPLYFIGYTGADNVKNENIHYMYIDQKKVKILNLYIIMMLHATSALLDHSFGKQTGYKSGILMSGNREQRYRTVP